MRICDLVNNAEFTFNVPFRILEYVGTEDDPDKSVIGGAVFARRKLRSAGAEGRKGTGG